MRKLFFSGYSIKKGGAFLERTLATFSGNERGFGFAVTEDGDYYIAAKNVNGAMDGDQIEITILHAFDARHSKSAYVRAVCNRAHRSLVGVYHRGRRNDYVLPLNPKIPYRILVPIQKKRPPEDARVVVTLSGYPGAVRPATGRIQAVLGKATDVGIDVLAVLYTFGIHPRFSRAVVEEAERVSREEMDCTNRLDLRDNVVFTIDGADAKDLDDAISVEETETGFLVGVHIADVSHYVTEKSRLDEAAFQRGTSVYPVDRVVPMLPKALSNHICSLHPHVDRLTLSVLMTITPEGECLHYEICPSVIRSVARLTYVQVQRVIDGEKQERAAHPDLTPKIDCLHRLAQILRKKRLSAGALDFTLPEAKIILDTAGKAVAVEKAEVGTANQLIEEWMLMANRTVAAHLHKRDLPGVYRIHESPEPQKLAEAEQVFSALGYPPLLNDQPEELARLLQRIKGTPEEATIHALLLRCMSKARYAQKPLGHYGLNCTDYCHFTSPIRRYPDLMVHRILKESLAGTLSPERSEKLREYCARVAIQASETEQCAAEAERECVRMKKAEYLSLHIGEIFWGTVCGISPQGFFVQLPNTIEGMVRFSGLSAYYVLDETRYCVSQEESGRVLRLGDTVCVTVLAADAKTGRIDFGWDENWDEK